MPNHVSEHFFELAKDETPWELRCASDFVKLLKTRYGFMATTRDQSVQEVSWEALRQRAAQLNVPAWRLAEDSAFHIRNDDVVMGSRKDQRQAALR